MYPKLFSLFDGKFTVYTYSLCIAVGLVLMAVFFRVSAKKLGMKEKHYDFFSVLALISVVAGFISAYLFQDFYVLLDTGKSPLIEAIKTWLNGGKLDLSGGITFMGGLIGGVVCFLGTTFIVCAVKKDYSLVRSLPTVADIAAPCILLAHGCGRIGCFFGGCCYGAKTDSALGVVFPGHTAPRHPTQLYEAIFLLLFFALMAVLLFVSYKRGTPKGFMICIYAIGYSIFRFFLEFLRDDYRAGADIGLTPSQVQSIIFIVVAIAYFALRLWWISRKSKTHGESENPADKA